MVERAVAGHPPRPKKMKKLWGTGDRGGGLYPEKF